MSEADAATVLLVEDNPQNRKLARTILTLEGHEVLEAPDARAALETLARRRPDVVLVDIQLPGMDGLELVQRLRSDPETADLVIVAMTAYAMRGDRERCLRAGCDGYLSKPIDPKTFAEAVATFAGKGRRREIG